ncbi:hypothetical protein F5Y12DRAFT_720343 [Xylaria sp. FL1777]|nr:hypothetical protein F5Y12DRAFT_720343 [Xylaria sp. FL1777]
MFSRIKDALDRTIAEEQARHKVSGEQKVGVKKPAQGNPTNSDPAVFEAAFKLEDDPDSSSPSPTPRPAAPKEATKLDANDPSSETKNSTQGQNGDSNKASGTLTLGSLDEPTLAPEVKVKLRRLNRLEATYVDLLRSYRIAHSRVAVIDRFERALRENTPLNTIKEPDAFVEYMYQLNLQSDMVVKELKRVSADKDGQQKRLADSEKEIATLRYEIATLEAAKGDKPAAPLDEADGKAAERGVEGEDMFSYDDEIPKLQAELLSKDEQIAKLTSEVDTLKRDLTVGKETSAGEFEEAVLNMERMRVDMEADKTSFNATLAAKKVEIDTLKASIKEQEAELEEFKSAVQAEKGPLDDPSATPTALPAPTAGSAKKKNKKKNRKKGGASHILTDTAPSETSEHPQLSPLENPETEALRAEVSKLKGEIIEKDSRIDKLSNQRKTEEDLREEIENMQENLINIGQDHVEAKERIKELENEKAALKSRISELEKELASSMETTKQAESTSNLLAEYDSIKKEFDELKVRSRALESDLGAAQKLAQERFEKLTFSKDLLAKIQPELKTLRQDSAALKTTREELVTKQNELRALEKREKELKNEMSRVQRISADRESEIKLLNDRLTTEKTSRAKLEDEKRTLGRDYRRSEAEKIEIAAKAEKTGWELEKVQFELSCLQPKVKGLEEEVAKLTKEKNVTQEDIDLKTQQYNNAQGLLTSMRDQITELSMQLKEAQNQAESLEEELAEVQKHLAERTREGETMRRMLADVDEQADAKVREMKSRLETAIEDRDRLEDESSTVARRRAREAEELKTKVRELEREVKALGNEKDDLEAREREWRRRREELEQIEEKATAETEDMRSTVSSLRSALDASEQQVRDAEKQKTDLRKLLDEARGRYERANKELKGVQSRLNLGSGSNVASSGRSSIDSTRSGLNTSPSKGLHGGPDIAYLKTIFLQFLEVKDDKVRSQLVPVLGKLLGLDKNEQEKWMQAVQHRHK